MKSRSILYYITVLFFSVLFYRQGVGLNYFIFAIILVGVSIYLDRTLFQTTQSRIASAGFLIATFFAMYYGNSLTITMSILSFFIFQTIRSWRHSSIIVALMTGFISVFGSVLFIIRGKLNSNKVNSRKLKLLDPKSNKWTAVLVVFIVAFAFLKLYSSINPVFEVYIEDALYAVSWGWFFFTLFSMILLYTFFFPPRFLRKVMRMERNAATTIEQTDMINANLFFGSTINYQSERFSAFLMFATLNLLLLLLIITDVNYLFIESTLPFELSYSDYVHSGVGAVILSIVLAILLIVFYYRGKLNFDDKSKAIKALTYTWIALNIILVVLTMVKNQLYIDAYALTYKRIGVYFYLLFSVIGLVLTGYKLYSHKSTWYLIKSNALSMYIVLIISCVVNWNLVVTKYNLQHNESPDYYYLNQLGHENYSILWDTAAYNYPYNTKVWLKLGKQRNLYELPSNLAHFLAAYEKNGIQSYGVTKQWTYDYFVKLAEEGKL